jgi:hypothetical protein
MLGKPQSFVSKYERRERRLDVVEIVRVALALGAKPSEMVKEIEKALAGKKRGRR